MNIPQTEKYCPTCKLTKSADCFYKSRTTGKLHQYCKECNRKRSNRYCSENKDKRSEKGRNLRTANPAKYLFDHVKQRCKQSGMEFNLEPSDIVVPAECPVFFIPLKVADGKMDDNSPSVDRIDPTKGYVKGNICVISWLANRIKNNGTLEDRLKIIAHMEKYPSKEQIIKKSND